MHGVIHNDLPRSRACRKGQGAALSAGGEGANGPWIGSGLQSFQDLEGLEVMDVSLALKKHNQPAKMKVVDQGFDMVTINRQVIE